MHTIIIGHGFLPSYDEGVYTLTEITGHSNIPDRNAVITGVDEEIERLTKTKLLIINEKIGWPSLFALIIAILFNVWSFATQTTTYMVLWLSAGLYFYLFYPLLPLFLFPFRYLTNQNKEPKEDKKNKSMLIWAKKLKIFNNKRVGFRLFMRFFILSLLPLTLGMICIYSLSIIYSIYLGSNGILPLNTAHLILIQCTGIILFYLEIFFFRHQIFNFVEYIRLQDRKNKRKIIFVGILGIVLLLVGLVVVILLLIAMLFPGFTLIKFINMSEFVRLSNNILILVILMSQVIIVQYLQSILSFRISRNMCDELTERLTTAKKELLSEGHRVAKDSRHETQQSEWHQIKEPVRVMRESLLYAFNMRRMFGLFPIISIGINIPNLLSIENLIELKEVFFEDT